MISAACALGWRDAAQYCSLPCNLTQEASEVVNFDHPVTGRTMCSGAIVANDEIADSCGTTSLFLTMMAVVGKKPVKSSYPMTTKHLPLADR
jgi:hypothetical protein